MTPTQILDHCEHTDYPPCRACADLAVLAGQRRGRETAARITDHAGDSFYYTLILDEAERIKNLLPDEKPCAVEALVALAHRIRVGAP
jgi:hypothetical protein